MASSSALHLPDIDADLAAETAARIAADADHEADTSAVHGVADTSALYRSSGTDVTVADGGTGASTAAAARTNLGLVIDTDVPSQASVVLKSLYDANTVLAADADNTPAAVTMGASTILARLAAGNIKATTPAELKTLLATLLDDLSDVAITSVAANHELRHDGASWANVTRADPLAPTGTIAESFSRVHVSGSATVVTGRLYLQAINLPKGVVITSVSFCSVATALSAGTNQFFGVYDDLAGSSSGTAYGLLRGSVNDGSAAWAADTTKTLNLTSTYQTTRAGLHYCGLLITATTLPTIFQSANQLRGGVTGLAPLFMGLISSATGLTALPNPATGVGGVINGLFWCKVQ